MPTVRFVSHPEVLVDPAVPVPQWGLSEVGRARAALIGSHGEPVVWCSAESKAREAAAAVGPPVVVLESLGENDRSATGFLPPAQFEATADDFFAHPDRSVRGWETARAAQQRIVGAVRRVLADPRTGAGDVLIVAHGGVGTLLLCHLLGVPVARTHDQPRQGCQFTFDRDTGAVGGGWRPLEECRSPE